MAPAIFFGLQDSDSDVLDHTSTEYITIVNPKPTRSPGEQIVHSTKLAAYITIIDVTPCRLGASAKLGNSVLDKNLAN